MASLQQFLSSPFAIAVLFFIVSITAFLFNRFNRNIIGVAIFIIGFSGILLASISNFAGNTEQSLFMARQNQTSSASNLEIMAARKQLEDQDKKIQQLRSEVNELQDNLRKTIWFVSNTDQKLIALIYDIHALNDASQSLIKQQGTQMLLDFDKVKKSFQPPSVSDKLTGKKANNDETTPDTCSLGLQDCSSTEHNELETVLFGRP